MQVAIPIYEGFTALDAIGPYDVLQNVPGTEVVFCAPETGIHRTENGRLGVLADAKLCRRPRARRGRRAGRARQPPLARGPERLHGLARLGARDDDLDDVGLHRLADARRRRPARRRRCRDPLGRPRDARRARRQPGRRARRRARQDRHRGRRLLGHRHGARASSSGCTARSPPRPYSSRSSTTPTRRTTPARSRRRRRRSSRRVRSVMETQDAAVAERLGIA